MVRLLQSILYHTPPMRERHFERMIGRRPARRYLRIDCRRNVNQPVSRAKSCSVRNNFLSPSIELLRQDFGQPLPCLPRLPAEIICREQAQGQQRVVLDHLEPRGAFPPGPLLEFARRQRTLCRLARKLLQSLQVSTVEMVDAVELPRALHDGGARFATARPC